MNRWALVQVERVQKHLDDAAGGAYKLNVFNYLAPSPCCRPRVAGRHAAPVTAGSLYLRCLAWGLATGAVSGGGPALVIGIVIAAGGGAEAVPLALLALAAGVVYGTVVAVLPTVLGGLAVVVVLARRHPRPADLDAVHRDLGVVFAAVVAVLDAIVVAAWLLLGGLDTVAGVVVVVLIVDAVVALMLKFARTSIARAWVEGGARP